jgi:hypothetical protein
MDLQLSRPLVATESKIEGVPQPIATCVPKQLRKNIWRGLKRNDATRVAAILSEHYPISAVVCAYVKNAIHVEKLENTPQRILLAEAVAAP